MKKTIYDQIRTDLGDKKQVHEIYKDEDLNLEDLFIIWNNYPLDESMRQLVFDTEDKYIKNMHQEIDNIKQDLNSIDDEIKNNEEYLQSIDKQISQFKQTRTEILKSSIISQEKSQQIQNQQKVQQTKEEIQNTKKEIQKPKEGEIQKISQKQEEKTDQSQQVQIDTIPPKDFNENQPNPSFPSNKPQFCPIDISEYNFIHPFSFRPDGEGSPIRNESTNYINLSKGCYLTNFYFKYNPKETYEIHYEAKSRENYFINQQFFYQLFNSDLKQQYFMSEEKKWSQAPAQISKISSKKGKITLTLKQKENWDFNQIDSTIQKYEQLFVCIYENGHETKSEISTFEYSPGRILSSTITFPENDFPIKKLEKNQISISIKKGSYTKILTEKDKQSISASKRLFNDKILKNTSNSASYMKFGFLVDTTRSTSDLQIISFKVTHS